MSDSGVGVEPSRHHCPTCGGPHEHPDTGIGGACDKYFLGNARRSTQENIRRNQEREAERSGVGVDPRIEAAVAAMDGYYQDREWPTPGLAVIEALMTEVFAAADACDEGCTRQENLTQPGDWAEQHSEAIIASIRSIVDEWDADQARTEAAAMAIGHYTAEQWERWQHTSKGQQAHDRAFAALAAADAVDPVRAEVSGLVGKLAEAEKERDAYHERFSAQMIAGSNLIAELAEANERFRSDGRLIEEIIGERDSALAQLAKIRELCDIVNHNYVEYKQTLRDVKTAYTKGVEDGVKSAMDRVAAVLGVPRPEPGNATETADGLHGAAENVTPVGVPQEQAPTNE